MTYTVSSGTLNPTQLNSTLIFENLDLEISFLVCRYMLITSRSRSNNLISRSWDQDQGHMSVDKYKLAGGQPATERQSCFQVN